MFTIPLSIVTSFLLTVSALYTIVAYIQLVLYEWMVNRDFPHAKSFKNMSQENKKGYKKIGWKIARGMLVFLVVLVFEYGKRMGRF
ncbi:MAG: hypothetical protein H7336_00505 [Bacteriovorax sp.]|nr:hypothetical protein [Bacteriovorax sp.]